MQAMHPGDHDDVVALGMQGLGVALEVGQAVVEARQALGTLAMIEPLELELHAAGETPRQRLLVMREDMDQVLAADAEMLQIGRGGGQAPQHQWRFQ